MTKKLIHHCYKTEGEKVWIRCLDWAGFGNKEIEPSIYDADFDDNLYSVYYTFNPNLVTCSRCKDE